GGIGGDGHIRLILRQVERDLLAIITQQQLVGAHRGNQTGGALSDRQRVQVVDDLGCIHVGKAMVREELILGGCCAVGSGGVCCGGGVRVGVRVRGRASGQGKGEGGEDDRGSFHVRFLG